MASVWSHIDEMKARHADDLRWFEALARSIRRSVHVRCAPWLPSPWRLRFYRGRARERIYVSASTAADALERFDRAVGT